MTESDFASVVAHYPPDVRRQAAALAQELAPAQRASLGGLLLAVAAEATDQEAEHQARQWHMFAAHLPAHIEMLWLEALEEPLTCRTCHPRAEALT